MYPIIPGGINSFLLVVVFIVIGATWYLTRIITSEGYSPRQIILLQFGLVLIALIGAKVFSLHLREWQLATLLSELESGWNYPGALIGLLLIAPWWVKVTLPGLPAARLCDNLAIVTAFSLAAFRVNCYLKGCCTGAPCEGAFCLSYAPGSTVWQQHLLNGHITHASQWSVPVLPLHLLFMCSSLLIGFFLVWFDKHKKFDGQVVLMFMFTHEASKAVLESFRVPYAPDIQMVSIAIAVFGALGLLIGAASRRLTFAERR